MRTTATKPVHLPGALRQAPAAQDAQHNAPRPDETAPGIAAQIRNAAALGHRFDQADVYSHPVSDGSSAQSSPLTGNAKMQHQTAEAGGRENAAGLPQSLKSGIEGHSGADSAGVVQLMRFSQLFSGKKLKASPKHIKGKPGGKPGKTTKASQEVMDHAQAQIESDAAEAVGEANKGNDYTFEVPRKHRHKKGSPKSRKFNVHKGGGDGGTLGFYMQEGEPSESESSEDEGPEKV